MPDSSGLRNLDSSELSQLALLARISSMINSASRFEEVLERIMESVLEVIRAERAFVLLREESPGDGLYKASGVGDASYSSRIVASVHESGKALVSLDALTDDCLSDSKSIQMLGTRSVMCVPMRTGSKILGLIYLDSRIQTEVFTESDRDLLQIIADMSAVALERARLFSAMLQNAKMATLGTAIGGIAHELNSPLTSLMWLVERFKEELPDSAGIVPEFERELKRCRNLSRNLLRIVRKEQTPVERVYLSEALENSLKLVRLCSR